VNAIAELRVGSASALYLSPYEKGVWSRAPATMSSGGTAPAGGTGGAPGSGTAPPVPAPVPATDPRLKNFGKAPQPLRSLLCNQFHDLPSQWESWQADVRSALAAHGVLVDNLTSWKTGTPVVLEAQDDAIFLRALRNALCFPGTLTPQPAFVALLSEFHGTGATDGVQLWKRLHELATSMTHHSPHLLQIWGNLLVTLQGLLFNNHNPTDFLAWSGFARSAFIAYAVDDTKKKECLQSLIHLFFQSPASFAAQLQRLADWPTYAIAAVITSGPRRDSRTLAEATASSRAATLPPRIPAWSESLSGEEDQ
jgi:hypothetical protein